MLPFFLEFTSQLHDFTSDYCQFKRQFLQLCEHRKGFLLCKVALHCNYCLVVIDSHTAELSIQSRQLLIIVKQRTIHFITRKVSLKILVLMNNDRLGTPLSSFIVRKWAYSVGVKLTDTRFSVFSLERALRIFFIFISYFGF